jgi:hypothetical protein
VFRQTSGQRLRRKVMEIKQELHRRMHRAVPEVGAWLRSVVQGHYRYYGVHYNRHALCRIRGEVIRLWYRSLKRRSQRSRTSWERMQRLVGLWLPIPHIVHPFPEQRLRV